MSIKQKIVDRMDRLQGMMESNQHLETPEDVYDVTLSVSKFWSILSEEDREYIQCAQYAIEEGKRWDV